MNECHGWESLSPPDVFAREMNRLTRAPYGGTMLLTRRSWRNWPYLAPV